MSALARPRAAEAVAVAGSLVVGASLLGLPLRADERWYPYLYGPDRAEAPWTLVTWSLDNIPRYLGLGNFRPIGRGIEHGFYLLQHAISVMTGLPMDVVLGAVRLAAIAMLGVLCVRLARALVGTEPAGRSPRSVMWVALAYPTLVVAAGNGSSVVVFSGLYFTSAALVVLAALAFLRPQLYEPGRLTVARAIAFGLLGAGMAATNEILYLAVPVAAVVSLVELARRDVRRPGDALRLPVASAALAAGIGFVLVFVPARIAIARACSAVECYANSSLDLTGWGPQLWVSRAVSGLPMAGWWKYLLYRPPYREALWVLLAAAVVSALVISVRSGGVAAAPRPQSAWRSAAPLLLVGGAFVGAAALLSSVSEPLQSGYPPLAGWRESPVSFVGWALILGAGAELFLAPGGRLRRTRLGLVLTGSLAALSITVVTNAAKTVRDAGDPRVVLADQIAVAVVSFGEDDRTRCDLLAQFDALHPDRRDHQQLLRQALDRTTEHRYGRPFCERGTP